MAMLALWNKRDSKYTDVWSQWGEITRWQKCVRENPVLQGRMTFHSQLPFSLPLFRKAHPSQPAFLWFLRWESACWFHWQESSHLLSVLISILKYIFNDLVPDPDLLKSCGFAGTKNKKHLDEQMNEIQLPSTSIKHPPHIKLCTYQLLSFLLEDIILCEAFLIVEGENSRTSSKHKSGSTFCLWGPPCVLHPGPGVPNT